MRSKIITVGIVTKSNGNIYQCLTAGLPSYFLSCQALKLTDVVCNEKKITIHNVNYIKRNISGPMCSESKYFGARFFIIGVFGQGQNKDKINAMIVHFGNATTFANIQSTPFTLLILDFMAQKPL